MCIVYTSISTRCHTLALIQTSGKVYSFGLGTCGQLGAGSLRKVATPTLVRGQWLGSEALTRPVVNGEERRGMVARGVFAGGDQSFASLAVRGDQVRGIRRRGRGRREKKGKGEQMVEGEEGIVFGFKMCASYELCSTTVVQDMSVISDHRQKQPGRLPPSLNYEALKEVLDEALITKDYTRASRYTCPSPNACLHAVFH